MAVLAPTSLITPDLHAQPGSSASSSLTSSLLTVQVTLATHCHSSSALPALCRSHPVLSAPTHLPTVPGRCLLHLSPSACHPHPIPELPRVSEVKEPEGPARASQAAHTAC